MAIPNIMPEDLNILAGKPKMGKSIMALNICIEVAFGGKALNEIDAFCLKQNTEWHKDEENGRDSVSPTYDADIVSWKEIRIVRQLSHLEPLKAFSSNRKSLALLFIIASIVFINVRL